MVKQGKNMKHFRVFFLTHSKIDFYFRQNSDDFVVKEVPLYEFSGEGEHVVFNMRKKNLTTWEALESLSSHTGIKVREFGYAGLKDKEALTYQSISVHKKYEEKLENFSHNQIKLLEKTYHKNKIKRGHLKGNEFFIRLKKVGKVEAIKIENALKIIQDKGIPNYFGYQRFGKDMDNHLQGKLILENKLKIQNTHLKNFLINAYQSYLFNQLLSKRVELSHLDNTKRLNFFQLLLGDIISHYPHGRLFVAQDIAEEEKRFFQKETSPTGLLSGKKVKKAQDKAWDLEKEFDLINKIDGARRYFWIFPQNLSWNYKEQDAHFELNFFLPKGAYATNLIEELKHENSFD